MRSFKLAAAIKGVTYADGRALGRGRRGAAPSSGSTRPRTLHGATPSATTSPASTSATGSSPPGSGRARRRDRGPDRQGRLGRPQGRDAVRRRSTDPAFTAPPGTRRSWRSTTRPARGSSTIRTPAATPGGGSCPRSPPASPRSPTAGAPTRSGSGEGFRFSPPSARLSPPDRSGARSSGSSRPGSTRSPRRSRGPREHRRRRGLPRGSRRPRRRARRTRRRARDPAAKTGSGFARAGAAGLRRSRPHPVVPLGLDAPVPSAGPVLPRGAHRLGRGAEARTRTTTGRGRTTSTRSSSGSASPRTMQRSRSRTGSSTTSWSRRTRRSPRRRPPHARPGAATD